ncbi:MAG: methylmalonyl Co-A mutase-associated GTPase MeaB [Planctomycetota bacterium]|jgi:LAO/AO transport system kinase
MPAARDPAKLLELARDGDRPAVARLITLAETSPEAEIPGLAGTPLPHVIGLTGSPGAGKSSLLDRLAGELTRAGDGPAILGVDPTSPFTGGALLGDRVRISEDTLASGVFVRSMASRGSAGGLARAVGTAVRVLGAAGFSPVLVETVGAGQGEVAIGDLADTVIVVLVPGMGDDIQMLKMGVLEIADIYAVNKADTGSADLFADELRAALSGTSSPCRARREIPSAAAWPAPVTVTSARTGAGVPELAAAVSEHRRHLEAGGLREALREARAARRITRALAELMAARASGEGPAAERLGELAAQTSAGQISELEAARRLLDEGALSP